MTIKVFAQQFAWRFEYPGEKNLKSDELVMPARPEHHVRARVGRRHPLVLDPGDGAEAGRRSGHPHEHRDHAYAPGELHAHLHRALRPRPRHHARPRERRDAGRLRGLGEEEAEQRGRRAAARARPCSPRPAAAAATPSRLPEATAPIGPKLDNVAADAKKAGEDPAAYVKESIVDPEQGARPRLPGGCHAGELRRHALAAGDRRPRLLPYGRIAVSMAEAEPRS